MAIKDYVEPTGVSVNVDAISSGLEFLDYTGKKGSSEAGGSCSKALMLKASTE